MTSEESPSPKNGKIGLLTTIAGSGDNMVKLATLGLVLLSGVGNFLKTGQATQASGAATRAEVDKVITQLDNIEQHINADTEQGRRNAEAIATLKANQEWLQRWINRKNLPPDSWTRDE